MKGGMDLILQNAPVLKISSDALAKIEARMPEINRAKNSAGRKNTQTTSQLMTLNIAGDEPYRHLRQILAQIERKTSALEEVFFKLKKDNVRLKIIQEKEDEMSLIRAEEITAKMERGRLYVEGAIKEIGMFQDAYDEIRDSHNIPEKWDEKDSEKAEIRHHIKKGFRNSFQEMMSTGMIGRGSAEYLEQFGVHPQSARKYLHDYIVQNEKLMDSGKEPTIEHFHKFLDSMADKFQESHKLCMKRIGLKTLVREEWCYRETV
jgi:exonuclease VII small subunit